MEAQHSNKSGKKQPKGDYTTGYCRPPKHTQFAKGKSGNDKGRPPGSKNIRSEIRKVYLDPVPMTVKGKRRRVVGIVALARTRLKHAFIKDRTAEAVFRHAKEVGVFDEVETAAPLPSGIIVSEEALDRLSDSALDELISIVTELEAGKINPKNLH